MNKVIRGSARDIIYKVLMRCMAEYQAGNLLSKLDDVYKRTADFTGVSESRYSASDSQTWHRKKREIFYTSQTHGAGTSQECSGPMDGVEYLDFHLLE